MLMNDQSNCDNINNNNTVTLLDTCKSRAGASVYTVYKKSNYSYILFKTCKENKTIKQVNLHKIFTCKIILK